MNNPFCTIKNCVNYKKGRCSLNNPEKYEGTCLHYEDFMNSLRLKTYEFTGMPRREK